MLPEKNGNKSYIEVTRNHLKIFFNALFSLHNSYHLTRTLSMPFVKTPYPAYLTPV